MSNTNHGGPAFPVYDHHSSGQQFLADVGMTLRDYFAVHASEQDIQYYSGLVGYSRQIAEGLDGLKHEYYGPPSNVRERARYMHADAMLKARQS